MTKRKRQGREGSAFSLCTEKCAPGLDAHDPVWCQFFRFLEGLHGVGAVLPRYAVDGQGAAILAHVAHGVE